MCSIVSVIGEIPIRISHEKGLYTSVLLIALVVLGPVAVMGTLSISSTYSPGANPNSALHNAFIIIVGAINAVLAIWTVFTVIIVILALLTKASSMKGFSRGNLSLFILYVWSFGAGTWGFLQLANYARSQPNDNDMVMLTSDYHTWKNNLSFGLSIDEFLGTFNKNAGTAINIQSASCSAVDGNPDIVKYAVPMASGSEMQIYVRRADNHVYRVELSGIAPGNQFFELEKGSIKSVGETEFVYLLMTLDPILSEKEADFNYTTMMNGIKESFVQGSSKQQCQDNAIDGVWFTITLTKAETGPDTSYRYTYSLEANWEPERYRRITLQRPNWSND